MKRLLKKAFIPVFLCAAILMTDARTLLASTVIDNANRAKSEANANLSETNQKISNIETEQANLQRKIDALDADLVALLIDIDVLEDEIAAKQEDIKNATASLNDAKEREADQYADMKLRIRYMYEHSKVNYLQSILESKSISELLNRVSYFNDVYEYDRTQLVNYQNTVQEVADYKQQLEQEELDMEELLENYNHESETLEQMLVEKRATMDDYDTQLATAQSLAAQYKATIDEQNRIIAAEEARLEEERRRREEEERRRQEEERRRQEEEQRRLAEQAERERQEAERRAAEAAAQQAAEAASETYNDLSDSGSSYTDTGSSYVEVADTGSNPAKTTSISGSDVCNYALSFVGNPYVWGGTSLTNGCDCSGFTQQIFKHFGVSIPRTSYEQRSCGNTVSYSNAQPGDIICYSGHVALYIGNGRIVGAQSSRSGITTANATYRTILSVRRVI